MESYADQMRKARCKGMIRSYLTGRKKTSLRMVLAFINPPHEKPLSRESVADLLQQVLLEINYPITERLAILKQIFSFK